MIKNIVKLHNECAEVIVISDKANYKHSVLIDAEDIQKIGKMRISNTGYAYQAKRKGKPITSIILGVDTNKDLYIDHINGNTLDNRKSNLRVCSPSVNARNRKTFSRNNTGTVGIAYRENGNYKYYRAQYTDLNNNRKVKQFNINKLGKETAFLEAKKWLDDKKKKNLYIV